MPAGPVVRSAFKKTGRTRTRVQKWTRKIVLQVEEEYRYGYGGGQALYTDTRWRDATHFDVAGN